MKTPKPPGPGKWLYDDGEFILIESPTMPAGTQSPEPQEPANEHDENEEINDG